MVENKLKGLFIIVLSIMYFVLLFLRLFFYSDDIAKDMVILYLALDLALLIIAFYIFFTKKTVSNFIHLLVISIFLLISTMMIYTTGYINSVYFPILYLNIIIFAALNKGRFLLYSTATVISALIIFLFLVSPYSLVLEQKITFLLYVIVFAVMVAVIRNYPFECLGCKTRNSVCPYNNSCPINTDEKIGGELSAFKLYKKSR